MLMWGYWMYRCRSVLSISARRAVGVVGWLDVPALISVYGHDYCVCILCASEEKGLQSVVVCSVMCQKTRVDSIGF